MSLINKMLQDLDARGGPNGGARIQGLSVARRRAPNMVTGLLGLAIALGLAGAIGVAAWKFFKKAPEPPKPAVTMLMAAAAPAAPAAQPAKAPAPAQAQADAGAAEDAPEPPADSANTEPAAPEAERPAAAPLAAARQDEEKASEREEAAPTDGLAAGAAAPRMAASPDKGKGERKARTVSAGKAADATPPIREMTPQQKAEADYRRANASLQEGRITEAVATLERALQLEPRHEAARQTLVSLLIEARRSDEAIRVLQAGLTLEPNQPNLAMLLARLQIERGGPGIETLQRTLPYAEGNPDYHAFLAGALQREQRHREAVEQYQLAVKGAPQSGVWLMGLGISLLAEKRHPEALDAFRRAKSSGNLTPELASYVDRRLQQLSR